MDLSGHITGWRLDHSGREVPRGSERSDAARNRQRILEAARGLFEERGVGEVTMEEISRRAAVGKGTLYRRYPNKGVLCQALLDEPTRRLQEEVMRLLGRPDLGPREKLCGFLELLVWFMEANLDLLHGGHQSLPPADRLAHPAYDWRRGTALGLLREAVRQEEIDGELDVEYVATALLAPLEVELYHHQRRALGISAQRISAGLRSLVPGEISP